MRESLVSHSVPHSRQKLIMGTVIIFRMKYFEHPELQAFRKEYLQAAFRFVSNVKPSSSRSESSEAYWVCSGFKG